MRCSLESSPFVFLGSLIFEWVCSFRINCRLHVVVNTMIFTRYVTFSVIYSFLFYLSVPLTNSDTACGPCVALERKYPNRQHDSYWIYLFFCGLRQSLTHKEKREENKRKWLVSSSLESSSLILNNIYSSSAALIVRINCTFLSSEWRFKSKATN